MRVVPKLQERLRDGKGRVRRAALDVLAYLPPEELHRREHPILHIHSWDPNPKR